MTITHDPVSTSPSDRPLRFDRRTSDRRLHEGLATALRLSGERFGELHALELVDSSDGGVGAVSDNPIEPGEVVSLGFADRGSLARRGIVRRCVPTGRGYFVGIQFQLGLAA